MKETVFERRVWFFDLDGTLIDSSDCHERAYLEALKSERDDLIGAFSYEQVKGVRTSETFAQLGVVDKAQIRRLTDTKQLAYRRMIEAGEVEILPGAYNLLQKLHSDGRLLCLVTGASRISTNAVLNSHGLGKFFSGTISGDDCVESKPHPECYLEGLKRYDVAAAEAVAVEDSLNGLLSARQANLDVIAVNNQKLAEYSNYFESLIAVYAEVAGG